MGSLPQGGSVYRVERITIIPLTTEYSAAADLLGLEVRYVQGGCNLSCY